MKLKLKQPIEKYEKLLTIYFDSTSEGIAKKVSNRLKQLKDSRFGAVKVNESLEKLSKIKMRKLKKTKTA